MKQGPSHNSDGGRKREPIAHTVEPCAAANIGIVTDRATSEPLYSGRGFEAPKPTAQTTHHCGSQGKHT